MCTNWCWRDIISTHGRVKESDALFEQAARMAPNNPRVMFERASTYVHQKRDLEVARKLLERYLQAPLTPDDPPREEAEALLKKARSLMQVFSHVEALRSSDRGSTGE